MVTRRSNPDFLNGVPELLALRLLARQPMYGYELIEAMKLASGQVFDFGEGCIYPILHRLEAEGKLTSQRETVQGRSRVVYEVTLAGQKTLDASASQWRGIVTAIESVLQPDPSLVKRPA